MLMDLAKCQAEVRWEQNTGNCIFSPQDHCPAHAASLVLRLLGKVLEFAHGTPIVKAMVNGISLVCNFYHRKIFGVGNTNFPH